MSVFSSDNSSLSASRRNVLISRLISSASAFGPLKPSSQGALRLPSPLRTGLVPLKTSGSSTSRTTRLLVLFLPCLLTHALFLCQQVWVVVLLAVTHAALSHGMNML